MRKGGGVGPAATGEAKKGRLGRSRWAGFPVAFLGYGFLYAWGYVSWSTASLSTRSVTGGAVELSWLASSLTVPLVLAVLAFAWQKRALCRGDAACWAALALAVAGSVLSVVYQFVPGAAGRVIAVASGLCTGAASAAFCLLWSVALSRLSMAALETVVPASFVISWACSVFLPSMALTPALVAAVLLVTMCCLTLVRARRHLEDGSLEPGLLEEPGQGPDGTRRSDGVRTARILLFAISSWALLNVVPMPGEAVVTGAVDLPAALGFPVAIAFSVLIIRFAARVDFQALAGATLAPFALSLVLLSAGGAGSPRSWRRRSTPR